MHRFRNNFAFGISASACILLALLLLVLPIRWVFAAMLAAAFHEACHAAAVYLCGGSVTGITVGRKGAVMTAAPMSLSTELLCALAGPLGSLLLLLLIRWIPRIAFCGAVHAMYNLLPVYPMDGGRALRCVLELMIPGKADRLCRITERICLAGIWILAIYVAVFYRLGLLPLVFAFTLWQKSKKALQTGL